MWEEVSLPSPATAHDKSPRPGPAPPARRANPVSALRGKTHHGLLPDGGKLPPSPQAATDRPTDRPTTLRSGPPGAAPPPALPAAAAAALTSERTRDRRRPTARTLFRERTNTLEATASPPPSARPLLRTRAQAPPPARGARREARREGEFSARLSWAPPSAGGDSEAGVSPRVQPSAGKPLGWPPRPLPVRSSLRKTWCQP